MKTLSILVAKIVIITGKVLKKNTSVAPGFYALKFDHKILEKFKMPKTVIAVTGSSGKGSISSTIAHVLRSEGYKVAHNSKGSNLRFGILTLLLENCSLTGKIKSDVIVFEVDERYTKAVFPYLKPNYVVISNITRDQPPRQGHFDLVYEEIKKALTDDIHLILNADDPYLQKFALETKCPITYYGIAKNKYTYTKSKFANLNVTRCPICNSKLNYNFYHFETLGDYHCEKCKFKRPEASNVVTKIDYDNFNITVNNKYAIKIPYNVLYCINNTLAAYSACKLLNISEENIAKDITDMYRNVKNFDLYQYKNRIVHLLSNKNENCTTFNQSLLYTDRDKNMKTIIIGWKEISRRYKFDDLSWLYDIDFELLKKNNIDKIICVGLHRFDIATRMKYSLIDEKKIVVFDDLKKACDFLKRKTKGNIYAILNFDYVDPFNEYMKGE